MPDTEPSGAERDTHARDAEPSDIEQVDIEQVDIEPLDVDGVGAIVVGTVLWAAALVVLLVLRDRLVEAGTEWWLWVCAAGALLGLPGLWIVTRRRAAYRRAGRRG